MSYKDLFENKKFRWLLISLAVVVPFEFLSLLSVSIPLWVKIPLFFTILVVFGTRIFMDGILSILKLNFSDINLLMTIAVFGAVYVQQLEEAAVIIVLFSLGDALEEFGVERSRSAFTGLVEKMPKYARIKERADKIPVGEVRIGEIAIIKPGEAIPLDGEVVKGESLVDEAALTGEPLPKNKYVGDPVYAGTMNGVGYLEIRVTKPAEETALSKFINLTYQSAEKKATFHRFIESFAKFYTPSVLSISLMLVVVPVFILGKPFDLWFTQALTLLIISCPCALVISTPVTIFSAIGNATRMGVLVKGGRFIEELGNIKAIAFDKTRTLTKGELIVSDIVPFNDFTSEQVIACAAGMEAFSEHPIAKSIMAEAAAKEIDPHEFVCFRAVPGKGVVGQCTVCYDKEHCIGNIRFASEGNYAERDAIEKVAEFEKQGKTAIVISGDRKVKGIIGITDEIRPESKAVIENLRDLRITPFILTGDNYPSSRYVAEQLGIADVRAELLPDQKVGELSNLIERYKHVAMVGDGVNDAPALASASVGIAMGAIGSDVAIENADIALMNDSLRVIPHLIGLGRKCVRKIRFNIISAVGIKLVFLALAIAGWSSLALAIFADVGVTVLVILNGLSIHSYESDFLK